MIDSTADRYFIAAHWMIGFRIGLMLCGESNCAVDAISDWDDFTDTHSTAIQIADGDPVNIVHKDHLLSCVNEIKRHVGTSWGAEI